MIFTWDEQADHHCYLLWLDELESLQSYIAPSDFNFWEAYKADMTPKEALKEYQMRVDTFPPCLLDFEV